MAFTASERSPACLARRSTAAKAHQRLSPLAEAHLRLLARLSIERDGRRHALQLMSLANEASVRLVDAHGLRWRDVGISLLEGTREQYP